MRILKILSGLLLIFTGIWCFANQGVSFNALAFVLGIVMIIVGIIGASTFLFMKNRPEGLGWLVSESLITVILGIVVLSGLLATEIVISVFFGMWLIFSSANRIVGSLTMLRQKSPAWGYILALGTLGLIIGIYAFINLVVATLSVGILVSCFFFIYGINVFAMGVALPHVRRKRKKRKSKEEIEEIEEQNVQEEQAIEDVVEEELQEDNENI
ncbi:MAG: HdeD family acid-resistance protein [Eubacteriales bacterium]